MATYPVSNTVLDLTGAVAPGIPVAVDLVPGPSFRISDSSEIQSRIETKTDVAGKWQLSLEESQNINPTDSIYRVTEYIPWVKGGKRQWFLQVRPGGGPIYGQLVEPSIPVGLVIPGNVTSGTRPTNPNYGDMIVESDTGKVLIYYGPNTGWQPPWNVGWGEVVRAAVTIDQTTSAIAAIDVPGLTVTIPAITNRKYEVRLNCLVQLATAVTTLEVQITDNAGTITQRRVMNLTGSVIPWFLPLDIKYREAASLGTGNVVRKVRWFVGNASAVATMWGANGYTAELLVRDIGSLAPPV